MLFHPKFTISIPIAMALTSIERTRGFLEAAQLSSEWIAKMQARALILEAHHTTHIEGTHLSLDQSEKLIIGEKISDVDSEDVKELLNYKKAFDFVADYISSQKPITEGLIREIHKKEYFTIQEYESLCPGINRRSLQRDLADLIKKGLISQEGIKKATRYRIHRLD